MAFVAAIKLLNLNCLLCAESCLLKFDFHVIAQIRSATAIICASARAAPKERLENTSTKSAPAEDFTKNFERIMETAGTETGATLHEGCVPEPVVCGALIRIHQDVISFAQFLEFFLGVRVVRIFVRMKLYRQLAIGAFDLLIGGSSADSEHFVIIAFVCSHATMNPS